MKVGLLGHGVVGKGVSSIVDRQDDDILMIQKILVKDENEMIDPRTTTNV